MRFKIITVLIIIISGLYNTCLAQNVLDNDTTWTESYERYRNGFKKLSAAEIKYCENLLKEVLSDLDTMNQCSNDNDCTLIEQAPFGNTVPFPVILSKLMEAKMKEYSKQCDGSVLPSYINKDLINRPVCWKNKCMVSTSSKKMNCK